MTRRVASARLIVMMAALAAICGGCDARNNSIPQWITDIEVQYREDMSAISAGEAEGCTYNNPRFRAHFFLVLWARYTEADQLLRPLLAVCEKAGDQPTSAKIFENLGFIANALGRYDEAEAYYSRSVQIDEQVHGPADILMGVLGQLGRLYAAEGRFGKAEPVARRSLEIAEQMYGLKDFKLLIHLIWLADIYREEGRYAEAEPLFKRSLAISEEAVGPDTTGTGDRVAELAQLYLLERRYSDAEQLLKRLLTSYERANLDLGVGRVKCDLANVYRLENRYEEAKRLYETGDALIEKSIEKSGLANKDAEHTVERIKGDALYPCLVGLSTIYSGQGRYSEAEEFLKRSLAMEEYGITRPEETWSEYAPRIIQHLSALAELYRAEGRITDGVELSRRAVGLLRKQLQKATAGRAGGDVEYERRRVRDHFLLNVALVNAAGQSTAPAESFQVAQLANASSAAKALANLATRFASGTDPLAVVVRQRQDLAQRWQVLNANLIEAEGKRPAERNAAAEAILRQQLDETDAKLDAIDAHNARDFPAYTDLSNPKPLETTEAQKLLAPKEAMLVYLVGNNESWLWALSSERAQLFKLDIGAKLLSDEVTLLRQRLDPDLNPDLAPFDAIRAHALYQRIVAPAAPLLDGAHHVFIIPDAALESLPFEVLVVQNPKTNPATLADNRHIAWFARDRALTVLPSVGTLRVLRKFASKDHARLPFVGIGAPVLKGTTGVGRGIKLANLFRGAVVDIDAVRELPPLPETAGELRMVAREMGAGPQDLYLGERASEPLLRRAGLDRYRVVEFATHGLMSGDLGLGEPALVLTPPALATPDNDGLLTASKVATFKLNADWVVLSACNTAAGDGTPDAGSFSGLAKAFFYAGARSLLVSHWSVPSHATVKLIIGAFSELAKNPKIGRAEALRRAQMAMLDSESPPELSHPMAWAPFVLVGEGGPGR